MYAYVAVFNRRQLLQTIDRINPHAQQTMIPVYTIIIIIIIIILNKREHITNTTPWRRWQSH